ncbi:hypothetical protein OF83DRAFT_1158491, partial [Amylostereum chailletii]
PNQFFALRRTTRNDTFPPTTSLPFRRSHPAQRFPTSTTMASTRERPASGRGRNTLVQCRCGPCISSDPNGCRIPQWEADRHREEDLQRSQDIRISHNRPHSETAGQSSGHAPRMRIRRPSDDGARKRVRRGDEMDIDQTGGHTFDEPADALPDERDRIPTVREHTPTRLGLYDDPDDQDEAQTLFARRDFSPLDMFGDDTDTDTDLDIANLLAELPPRTVVVPVITPPIIEPPLPAPYVLSNSHDKWFIRILLIVTAFLHTEYHLPFRGCAVLLFTLRTIFVALGLILNDDPTPITLTTTFKLLDLGDRFDTLIACSRCHRLHVSAIASGSTCAGCSEPLFNARSSTWFQHLTGQSPPPPTPKLAVPYQSLSSMLAEVLSRPGMEEEVGIWKTRGRRDGVYNDIMDGAIWKDMLGPDGQKFFRADNTQEIRIVTTARRYDPKNLLVNMMTPGPSEPTAEQLQEYLVLIIDELIRLYDHGIVVRTPLHPEGILVRFVLLGIVCDHPAMCKMGGFADHRHDKAPCTKCKVTRDELYTDDALRGAHPQRDGQSHKDHAQAWRDLDSKAARKKYFDEHGVRWTEFARLRYFDPVRMTVVDPMHNLLLGVVKNQWYSCWILGGSLRATTATDTKRELAMVHEFLDSLEVPAWLGRLPLRVGEPAGGSLGADEYKMLITTPVAMLLPFVWNKFLPAATTDYVRAREKLDATQVVATVVGDQAPLAVGSDTGPGPAPIPSTGTIKTKKKKKGKKSGPLIDSLKPPSPRIHPDETRLTLLLATAIKVLLAYSQTDTTIKRGEELLTAYLLLYKKIHTTDSMKPNHHFAGHIGDQIRDYGPVPGFWAFLTERLNKILKGFNLNNWSGGQMEITMMRSMSREVRLKDLVVALNNSDDTTSKVVAERLLGTTSDVEVRGTVQDLARDPGVVQDFLSALAVLPGPPVRAPEMLSPRAQLALYRMYNDPSKRVYWPAERLKPRTAPFLTTRAQFSRYVILDGRRITSVAESQAKTHRASSSIVKAIINGHEYTGEVLRLFQHAQAGLPEQSTMYAEMNWLVPALSVPIANNPWADFPELQVKFWVYGKYLEDGIIDSDGPPSVIPMSLIRSPAARSTIRVTSPPMWVTSALERHSMFMGVPVVRKLLLRGSMAKMTSVQ